ncbi:hypothetical protein RM780_06745 [Streptomyces sp. DSM 44917]|uniref:Integral membrane protein n=1 Tax=Streptomyces boetiae TaxID=3075541 RepID=A0ABU2L526_9ACTN|nr:hypothetical protein [Streptomyces sp. DSM 44917]MDT0306659.1 hypothetical protein [Streptomyces sp. DSM 44917]
MRRPGAVAVARAALGAAGVALVAAGVRLLLVTTAEGTPWDVARWLAGAVLLHDLVLVPLVLAAGLALRRVPGRGAVRGGLLTAGCLVLVALPALLRPGGARNPTVVSTDYGRNLALALAAVAVGTTAAWAWSRRRAGRATGEDGERPGEDDAPRAPGR